jgi:hypothetical protein
MKGEDAADLSASSIVRRSRIASRNAPHAKTSTGVKMLWGWIVRRGARSGFTLFERGSSRHHFLVAAS